METKNKKDWSLREKELFKVALYRRSFLIFDSFGISCDMSTLETALVLRVCHQNYYGTHRLSKLWCRYLRPRLRPNDHLVAKNAFIRARELHQQAFISRVIEQATAMGLYDES